MIEQEANARVILIGCGPHAKRVYLPALQILFNLELMLVVDLIDQRDKVIAATSEYFAPNYYFVEPFSHVIPDIHLLYLSRFVAEHNITGVIIATEPLAHRAYAEWALTNGLNILMDKPVSTRTDATSNMKSAEGILEDYMELLDQYQQLQLTKETVFIINSQRRFHKGFQLVNKLIRDVALQTNCPVTFIQAYHSDGQWRLPHEIITQSYHPYCTGYGKASHSGYHIFDTIYQIYNAAQLFDKEADCMEIMASFIQPNGFYNQINQKDYLSLFGEDYKKLNRWSDEELKQLSSDFGEIDLSAIVTLKKDAYAVANFSINLIHNGFAGRTWSRPGEDLYKGNGRIKHESYHIQQGPFQNIQIHSYQAYDNHDTIQGPENQLGGKNHFDIYVFRNPIIDPLRNQPEVYHLNELIDETDVLNGSRLSMESVKFKVVQQFANYLLGKIDKVDVLSQIEDHHVPVQIMSSIYRSHVQKGEGISNLVQCQFGQIKSYI
jgi:predicted dehydrogenase